MLLNEKVERTNAEKKMLTVHEESAYKNNKIYQ
jgi:hypothetical protein